MKKRFVSMVLLLAFVFGMTKEEDLSLIHI